MIKDYAYNKLKDVKGVVRNCKSWNRQKVTKIKRTNIQIMINKTLHRKKKIEQHETYYNTRGNSCASDGKTIPAPLVAPVVILLHICEDPICKTNTYECTN
jgi:hypothetical protein